MDKENLYYIIQKGTNQRATQLGKMNSSTEILICNKDDVPIELEWYKRNNPKREYVAISIREYEDKFSDDIKQESETQLIVKLHEILLVLKDISRVQQNIDDKLYEIDRKLMK